MTSLFPGVVFSPSPNKGQYMRHQVENFINKVENKSLRGADEPIKGHFGHPISCISDAMVNIEKWNQVPHYIVMSDAVLAKLKDDPKFLTMFDQEYSKTLLLNGIRGAVLGMTVFVTDILNPDPGLCYLIADTLHLPQRAVTNVHFTKIEWPVQSVPSVTVTAPFSIKSTRGGWMLIRQKSTGSEKWVSKKSISDEGMDAAFYDADPTWVPGTD